MAVADLEIEDDDVYQRREWRAERIGWLGLCIFVGAAALGMFGNGPLSHATAADGGRQLTVRYERFIRESALSEIRLEFARSDPATSEVAVWIDRAYLRDLDVSSMLPEPTRVEHHGDRVVFVFSLGGPPRMPADIVLRYRPTRAGRLIGRIGRSATDAATVRQFAYF
jgi:hypothetical protein